MRKATRQYLVSLWALRTFRHTILIFIPLALGALGLWWIGEGSFWHLFLALALVAAIAVSVGYTISEIIGPKMAITSSGPDSPPMAQNPISIEEVTYNLEVEKFKWQKALSEQQNTILNRHFGVIITAIVSIAAIAVSYLQLGISQSNLRNEEIKNDRQFYLEVAKFLIEHERDVTSQDQGKIEFLKNVVISTFPREVATRVCTQMGAVAPTPEATRTWGECVAYFQRPGQPLQQVRSSAPQLVGNVRLGTLQYGTTTTLVVRLSNFAFAPNDRFQRTASLPAGYVLKAIEADHFILDDGQAVPYAVGICVRLLESARLTDIKVRATRTPCPF
jgi:hypothetical protein